jgi:hypothetical protein
MAAESGYVCVIEHNALKIAFHNAKTFDIGGKMV